MRFRLDINSRQLLSAARWAEAERRSAEGHATVDHDLSFMAQLESVWSLVEKAVISLNKEDSSLVEATTSYGFRWGVAKVQRVMEYRGLRVISIDTPHRHIEISVSPTGRSVRVWRDGKELS